VSGDQSELARAAFRALYEAWRRLPLPDGSADDDDVDELHADLALAVVNVAGPVVTFINTGKVASRAQFDANLGDLTDLLRRADTLASSASGDGRERATEYQAYIRLTTEVWQSYLAVTRPHP